MNSRTDLYKVFKTGMMPNSAARLAANVKMIALAGEENDRFHPKIANNGGVKCLIICSEPQSHSVFRPIL